MKTYVHELTTSISPTLPSTSASTSRHSTHIANVSINRKDDHYHLPNQNQQKQKQRHHHYTTGHKNVNNDNTQNHFTDEGDTSFEIDDPDEDVDEVEIKKINDDDTIMSASKPLNTNRMFDTGTLKTATETTITIAIANKGDGDDADDESKINCNAAQSNSSSSQTLHPANYATCAIDENCVNAHSVPIVAIRYDSGEQSDLSLESDTDSSTPTTADIADLTTNNNCSPYADTKGIIGHRVPLPSHAKMVELVSQNVRLNVNNNNNNNSNTILSGVINSNNGSIADDNLSGSIATTTTDVDIDNITIASPNMSTMTTTSRLHGVHTVNAYSPQTLLNSTTNVNGIVDVSTSGVGQLPSAAYLQSDARHQSDAIISTSHRRTLSAASYRSTSSQHPSLSAVSVHSVHSRFYNWIRWMCVFFKSSGIGEPSVYHALVVIFLEFFAWGLLTMPVISVLNQTFPDHTFLMNGLVMGIKGILSFLSAPLIGALSDIWGRKFFLLITVFFTCAPIPLMAINSWWFFAMISISGIFAVTFSVVFAYVADVTTVEERSRAYGLVSATFAGSLVISPALGAALMEMYSDTLVVALATAIAVLDVFFILVAVPESLPEKVRPSSWGAPISWEQADPFAALRKVGTDHTILMQCVTVLLSYLPEAGQYSCIFVYIKLKMGFNSMEVAIFIAVVGILSISIQVTLGYLMRVLGAKRTIILGLVLEMLQLLWYGFGSQKWMMWAAGVLAALGSITYPAISAFVSIHSTPDRQGAVQGMVTGMRGLCNGLGPAMFGVIFYFFNVDLNDEQMPGGVHDVQSASLQSGKYANFIPGPPFLFGAFMVILAILVAIFIPEGRGEIVGINRAPSEKKRISLDVQYEIESGHKSTGPLAPLMRSDSLAQL